MELHEGNTKRQLHRILGRINIGYDLPWGIKYNANLGYVKVDHYSKDFKHAMYTYNPKTLERKNFSAYVSAKDWDNNAINYTFYNTLSWGKSFGGNHNFNVMVGTEYKRYDGKNFQAKKRDYFNNQLTALSVGSTMEDISGGSSLELLFSYFGRITYDYKEKYLIDVTARYDGSSKFAKGNDGPSSPPCRSDGASTRRISCRTSGRSTCSSSAARSARWATRPSATTST